MKIIDIKKKVFKFLLKLIFISMILNLEWHKLFRISIKWEKYFSIASRRICCESFILLFAWKLFMFCNGLCEWRRFLINIRGNKYLNILFF